MNDTELFAISLRDTMIPALEGMITKEEAHLQWCKDHRKIIKITPELRGIEKESRDMLQYYKKRLREYETFITNTFGKCI